MSSFDLCLAWNWEYDTDFVNLLLAACDTLGQTVLQARPDNILEVTSRIMGGADVVGAFFDRASESDPRFSDLAAWAEGQVRCFNPPHLARWANDKSTMHLEFIHRGLDTPYTIILPPFSDRQDLPPADLSPLGGSFAIKPAHGGGGEGVVLEASTWGQVLSVRQQFAQEKYLLQAHVTPRLLEGRPAWFRVLFCCGAIYPCWWNPRTHAYRRLTAQESFQHRLRSLREIPARIAQICRLDLFSTEIALTESGSFLVVDYVNDPVDLRLQSCAADGAPDAIVTSIAGRIATWTGLGRNA
jgi:hypothetical protein